MRRWTKLRLRLRSLFRGPDVDRELDAELQFHLDELIAERTAGGLGPDDARAAALRAMGGLAQLTEECRDARGIGLVETMWQDVRFGGRLLAKHPLFTFVAVATLAVGIGLNTVAFSAARSLLFARLPLTDPARLVLGEALREGFDPGGTSLLEFTALRTQPVFEKTAVSIDRSMLLRGSADADQVHAAAVSPGFFETVGTAPVLGRGFTPDESRPGGTAAVLLSYGFWQRRFGGDAFVVGQALRLDDRAYTIAGVMPRGFDYPSHTEAWIPLDVDPDAAPASARLVHSYIFVARLRAGVTRAVADDFVKEAARRLEREYPQTERGWSYGLLTMRQWSLGDDDGRVTRAIVVLLLAIALLMLICCVNVASLLLVRGVVRERELAIRVGLGASAGRIAQQLFTEGALLSIISAIAGLGLASGMRPVFQALNPIQPHAFGDLVVDFQLDSGALFFCLSFAVLTGLLVTSVPAARVAAACNPGEMLRARERRAGGGSGGRRLLRGLVVVEVALAVSLSFGGALLAKSFYHLGRLDLGFRPENLFSIQLPLSPVEYPTQAAKAAFIDRVLERVRATPGVRSAGMTSALPMEEFSPDTSFTVEGRPPRNPSDVPIAALRHVTPGYAQTLGLTLVKGRLITERDRADTEPVAVITEELARQAFGVDDAIGKRLRRGRLQTAGYPWMVVVGIVRDAKEDRLNFRIARPVLYVPLEQRANPPTGAVVSLVVRPERDPSGIAAAVRTAIHDVNAYQPLVERTSVEGIVASLLSSDRFSARLMMLLAAVGLFLSAIGLYTVIAYSVTQRTGEIGLRMALGARPRSVAWLIAREGGVMVLPGLAMSVPLMLAIARLLADVLYDVRASDPSILAGLVAILATVTLVACALPLHRALRLDPVQALQYE